MHRIEERILQLFKENPEREFKTTEIVETIFSKNFGSDKILKAQLHRKALYHLNKLVDSEILKVSKVIGKGEKCFSLTIQQGEILLKSKKTIIISNTGAPSTPIGNFEENKVILKYELPTWISKLNSVLINASELKIKKFFELLKESVISVNDSVGIINLEHLMNKHPEDLIDKLVELSLDYHRTISISINVSELPKLKEFLELYTYSYNNNLLLVFEGSPLELHAQSKVFLYIIDLFKDKKIKLNIKNSDISKSPYIIGKIGPYTINYLDWNVFLEKDFEIPLISLSQSSIIVDVNKFFRENSVSDFRESLLKVANSLLSGNIIQRKRSDEFFQQFDSFTRNKKNRLFSYSSNYIRFWNYDWEKDYEFVTLLNSCIPRVKEFCSNEETIYKSCGMPIRFRISFSSVIKRFDDNLSHRNYSKVEIKSIKDIESVKTKKFLRTREELFESFDGGDRVRFFRTGDFENKDVLQEVILIMNSYRIPYFCFDFTRMRGNTKLTHYF